MGKHNGKARKGGERVGAALSAKSRKGAAGGGAAQFKHTTDINRNMQSVLDRNDLEELMAMADLADRDFTAERGHQVIVLSTGVVDPLEEARLAEERAEAEARNAHRLQLPRRPAWSVDTTAEELDLQERTSFLAWRRGLAQLEEEEKLVLTPFEKNLEVWRQLWRVVERSDTVVQVVDARDPLLYRSEDLEAYAREVCPTKSSLILLNKADLLPPQVRTAWADYFDKAGVSYAFWSAAAVAEEQQRLRSEAASLGVDPAALKAALAEQQQQQQQQAEDPAAADPRIKILDAEEVLDLMEQRARAAVAAGGGGSKGGSGDREGSDSGSEGPSGAAGDSERRLMVGLIGYPNVGKSSSINALFGAKKTAVAPTPGKTKHFQTLNVSPTVTLCDCPGLVMPKFAKNRAEMVAAGVIPIDRLTDIRQPVEVVAQRVGRPQVQDVYGIKLPPPAAHLPPCTPPTAEQLLRSYAVLRGWTVGSGMPDEARAGRQILKDYTNGKLLYCGLPPGSPREGWAPATCLAAPSQAVSAPCSEHLAPPAAAAVQAQPQSRAAAGAEAGSRRGSEDGEDNEDGGSEESGSEAAAEAADVGVPSGSGRAAAGASRGLEGLDLADLDLLESLGPDGMAEKSKRPDYKFNKKAARSKGDRGQVRAQGTWDGAGMETGKKGGLVRVGGY